MPGVFLCVAQRRYRSIFGGVWTVSYTHLLPIDLKKLYLAGAGIAAAVFAAGCVLSYFLF